MQDESMTGGGTYGGGPAWFAGGSCDRNKTTLIEGYAGTRSGDNFGGIKDNRI